LVTTRNGDVDVEIGGQLDSPRTGGRLARMVAGRHPAAGVRWLAALIGLVLWWPAWGSNDAATRPGAFVGDGAPSRSECWTRELGETRGGGEDEVEDGFPLGSDGARFGLASRGRDSVDWSGHDAGEFDARERDFERERGPPSR
jgi:hypothetical protein